MASNRLAKVVITLDGSRVEVGLDKIRQKTQEVVAKMQTLANAGKQNTKEYKECVKALNTLHKAETDVASVQQRINTYMKDLGNVATTDLRRAYREGIQLRDGFKGTDAQLKKLNADLAAMKVQIDKNTGATNNMTAAQKGFSASLKTTLKNLVAYGGVFALFNKIKSTITDLYKKNIQLSDELTNVRKVSQLAEEDINRMAVALAKIDTRTTVHELNNLAYAGAKLGMGQYGAEGLASFVRAADKVNVALKEDLGDDALTAMSKLVEVMGLIPKMGIEKSMDAAGSAIFMLSTSSTATGANIIEFSKRLMGLANVSHVAVEELLALGSASDAMGLMPEVSATAFNKVFTSIQTNTRGIAAALGDAKGELQALIDEGKTMEGIVYVLDKMHNMSVEEMKGRGLFKELGSDGARLNNVIATMANRIDMLKNHLDISAEAFDEATAVQREYEMQMESAAGYADRAANVWEKAFVNPEGVDVVKQLAVEWYNLANEMTHSATTMTMIKSTLGLLAGIVKQLIKVLPILLRYMMFYGVGTAIQSVYNMVVNLRTALLAASGAAGKLNAVMKANMFAFAFAGAMTLYTALTDVSEAEEDLANKQKSLNDYIAEGYVEMNRHKLKIDEYIKALEDANIKEETRRKILARFNKEYKPYIEKLGLEINSVTALKNAYALLNKELQKKVFYDVKNRALEEFITEPSDRLKQATMNYYDVSKSAGIDYLSASDIADMANEGKSSFEIMAGILERRAAAKDLQVKWLGDENNPYRAYQLFPKDFDLSVYYNSDIPNYEIYNTDPAVQGYMYKNQKLNTSIDTNISSELFEAVKNVVVASRGVTNTINYVNDAFKGFDTGWSDLIDDGGGDGGYKPGPTNEEIAEEKDRLRKDLKDAKEQSDAVISKIEEWYRLQETVITDMQADGKLTKEQAEQVVRTLNIAKNTALRDARLAISGRDTKAWEQTKQQIGNLMLDQGKWSQELLEQILGVSMESIRANLAKIDAGGGKYGITTSSLKDAVDKNAAGNQREIARLRAQSQQEVEKILLEYHYVETAIKGFSNRLAQMGILSETAQHMAERMADANDIDTLFSMRDYDKMLKGNEQAKRDMLQAFIGAGTQKYGINPENKEQLRSWFMEFVGQFMQNEKAFGGVEYQYLSWAKPFEKDFELWLRSSDDYLDKIQAFYFSLIKSEDEYYEAMKKAYNKQKALFAQRWENSGRAEAYDNLLKQLDLRKREQALTGKDKGTNFVDQAGFSNLNEDPEIAASIARMQQAKEELELFRETARQKHLAGEELAAFQKNLREKEMAATEAEMAMQEQLMKSIGDRISKLQEWTQPIENFGTEVGQALYDQWHNGESMTAKWQDMLKKMGLAWGQLTIKIVSELMMQRIKQNIIDKAMQADAIKHQATMSTIEQTGGQARQLVQQTTDQALIQGNQTTNTIIETQQQAHNATTLSEDVGQAAAENPVNISRAAGKTLAGLGWWGIPLVAVVTALLNALLQAALGSSSRNSKNEAAKATDATKMKLVSGMLTYDKGNVQRFIGQDGKIYTATEEPAPKDGLVTHPIATTVQGQPAIVAERGPEIVIGRKTTKAIMMNEPELIRYLANYQQQGGRRLFDSGNTSEVVNGFPVDNGGSTEREALRQQMTQMQEVMAGVLYYLQHPVRPKIDMYSHGGEDGLYDSMQKATKFMSRYKG